MVQVFDASPTPSSASMIGNALGMGLSKNFADPQQLVQRGMLEEAMSKLPENANYIDMLKTIGPQLMTTPGGSQLLAEMGPILQKQAQTKAYLDYMNGANNQGGGSQDQELNPDQPTASPSVNVSGNDQGEVKPFGRGYYRNPVPPVGKEGTYPKMSALPQPKPLLTPEQQQQRKQQLARSSLEQGQAADPIAIENLIMNEQNQIMKYNEQIEAERQTRENSQQDRSKRLLTRFNNAVESKDPEDSAVFERFANEARDASNENDAYQYARTKYNQFETARNGLIREADVPGFFTKLYRKSMGTYKDKEDMIKGLQPNIRKLMDLGLEDQARQILSNDVGLGMEDTELALYPPSKEESNLYNSFANNPKRGKYDGNPLTFPGEESALDRDEFIKFKDSISSLLQKYPETNIVALRGVLNQNKGYAWTDIGRAFSELVDEGRYELDPIIEKQLNVIKSPPIPGLGAMFKEFWTGTK